MFFCLHIRELKQDVFEHVNRKWDLFYLTQLDATKFVFLVSFLTKSLVNGLKFLNFLAGGLGIGLVLLTRFSKIQVLLFWNKAKQMYDLFMNLEMIYIF